MRDAAKFSFTLLLLVCASLPANAQEPVVPVTLTRIDLAVTINYGERTLNGTAALRVRNHRSEPATRIPVQTNRLMEVSKVTDAQGAPLHFTQDVVRYNDWPSYQINQVWIDLSRVLGPQDSTAVMISYNGYLTPMTETGMLYVRESIDSAFTMLRWESGGFPFLGVPNYRANHLGPHKDFDFSARITVPQYEVVATGGTLGGSTRSDSMVTYEYRSVRPVPFLNIGIAPYRITDASMRMFYFPQDSAGAAALLSAGQRAMDRMTQWFGPVGDETKPSIIEIGNGYGSQASLLAGVFQQSSGFQGKEFGELYHELSHLWNAPNTEAGPSRWNEGLAMFLQTLLMEQNDGWAKRATWIEGYATQFVKRQQADTLVTHVPLIDYGRRGSTDNSYAVGNFMMTVLYQMLGPQEFNRVIGGFYQKYHASGATDQQFVTFAKHTAHRDLSAFFNDWFLTANWYARIARGETLGQIAASYAR